MMPKFIVQCEKLSRKDVTVDADTYEHAVAKVYADPPREVAALVPAWVDLAETAEAYGVIEHSVMGRCARCEVPLVSRAVPGQPWVVGVSPLNESELWCYACIRAHNREAQDSLLARLDAGGKK